MLDESRTPATRDDWCTPTAWVTLVRTALGGIMLDPCASPDPSRRFAKINWTQDGLDKHWHDQWFCNPPYGPALRPWADKAVHEWLERRVEGIFLCPARTETRWFRVLAEHAALVAFPNKRIKFIDPTGDGRDAPKMPNALLCFAPHPKLHAQVLAPHCTLFVKYDQQR